MPLPELGLQPPPGRGGLRSEVPALGRECPGDTKETDPRSGGTRPREPPAEPGGRAEPVSSPPPPPSPASVRHQSVGLKHFNVSLPAKIKY